MESRIQLRIGGLDPQKIAVCASLTPSAVCSIRLLTQAERNAEIFPAPFMYSDKHTFDKGCILFALDLSGLKNHIAVSVIMSHLRTAHDLIGIHPVAYDLLVAFAYSAIKTILCADVPALHKATQGDNASDLAALNLVCGGEQFLYIGPFHKTDKLLVRKHERSCDRL
jgi:hypothetical protein